MRTKRFSQRLSTGVLVAGGLFFAAGAGASPIFELAGSASGNGGFNARVTGAGAPSTYFNPALLPQAQQDVELGILILSDQISMTLDGRTGGNVPLVVGDRQIVDANGNPIDNATMPTDWLEQGCSLSQCGEPPIGPRPRQGAGSSGNTRAYAVLGLATRLIEERLVFGFHALVPMSEFTTAYSFYNDEREQFFSNSLHPEMYSDRLTATSLAFGAASQIVEEVSAGVSFTLNLTNQAGASTYVRDPIDYDKLLVSTDVSVKTSVSPHFGVTYEPADFVHLAGTVHTPQRFTIETTIAAALPAGNESDSKRTAVHSYLPWIFALGGVVDLNQGAPHELAVAATLKYALWSNYIDRHGERPGNWGDVLSPVVGVRHRTGKVRTYFDVTYEPTPVPPQIGRHNYVDNDRVGATAGADYQLDVLELPLRVGLGLQAHRLIPRHQTKNDALLVDELPDDAVDSGTGMPIAQAAGLQTNNPGWPGFESEGWILGGFTTVALFY